MISEEEKKAIENVKLFLYKDKAFVTADEIDLVFNLIEKQQKEIEEKTTILFAGAEKVKQLEKEIEELEKDRKLLIQGHKMAKHNLVVLDGREYISKDKIKARIKELENKPKHGYSTHSDFLYESDEVKDIVIDNLKELLGE